MKKSTKTLKTTSPAKQVTPPTQQASDLLTVEEVSRVLRVDGTTCRRWIKQGTLEAVILPHQGKRQQYRITRETLENVLGKHEHAK